MSKANQWTVKKEMGISHKELFRKIPLVFKGNDFQVDGLRISHVQNGQTVEIVVSEEMKRILGLVVLPITHVELNLTGFDESEKNTFIAHFDMQYFRGGG